MLSKKVRPRLVSNPDSLLLILRVADTLEVSDHEELRSLRIYADQNRIISTSLYPLPVIQELLKKWEKTNRKQSKSVDLFMDLTVQSVRGLEGILEDVEDQTDFLEKQVLDTEEEDPLDRDITTLELTGLHLRRCLAPQKEVLSKLIVSELSWLGHLQRKKVRELHERVSRQLDETEMIRDRARIIREQLTSHVAEQVNHRLYVFSVVGVVFIPLGFLTGLFGANVGGIPGAENPLGFFIFCVSLLFLTVATFFLLKKFKWL